MLNDESVNEGRKDSQASDTQGGNLTFPIISKSLYVSKLTYLHMKTNRFLFMYFKSIILVFYQLLMLMGEKKQ